MRDSAKEPIRRKEPIFNLMTPLLFAHRGGVLEKPEGTEKAFNHALENAQAEILEIDVQLTKDGIFVVWHGPGFDNVRIEGVDDDPGKRLRGRREIFDFTWDELDGRAWVADPDHGNLSDVPKDEDRQLLLLSSFLAKFQDSPVNIEMKETFKNSIASAGRTGLSDNIGEFLKILDAGKYDRTIVVVSAQHGILKEFRNQNGERYPTNLSGIEQFYLFFSNKNLNNRALETSHVEMLSSRKRIEKVRRLGGSTFVFLTESWPFPSIDTEEPSEKAIFNILDRGVDGIMTDRPSAVRKIINKWIEQKL